MPRRMTPRMAAGCSSIASPSPPTSRGGLSGQVRCELGQMKEGLTLLKGALRLEIQKDAFHLETVWELLSRLKDLHMDEAKDRQARAAPERRGRARMAVDAHALARMGADGRPCARKRTRWLLHRPLA